RTYVVSDTGCNPVGASSRSWRDLPHLVACVTVACVTALEAEARHRQMAKTKRRSQETAAENPKKIVHSGAKRFNVLRSFDSDRHALTLTEIATLAGTDRGTAFRLVRTLLALGYIQALPPRHFALTFKCLELGFNALSAQHLPAHSRPMLRSCVPGLVD